MSKYKKEQELTEALKSDVHFDFTPQSTDTYDEAKLLNAVTALGRAGIQKCFMIACSFAIKGAVKGSYGTIKIDGKEEPLKVSDLIDEVGCRELQSNDDTSPETITVKRLARLFRYQIRDYIREKGTASFLVNKYNPECTDIHLCFPGAEYFVTKEQSGPLIKAYNALDISLGTNFTTRIILIIAAREKDFDWARRIRQHSKIQASIEKPVFNFGKSVMDMDDFPKIQHPTSSSSGSPPFITSPQEHE